MKKKYFYSGMTYLFCHSGANLLLVRTQILLFFFVFLLPLSGVASPLQEIRITIQQKNVPLSKVFKEIEEKTDCSFLIRNNDVNTNEKVSIDAKNKTVAEILGILFDGGCKNGKTFEKFWYKCDEKIFHIISVGFAAAFIDMGLGLCYTF